MIKKINELDFFESPSDSLSICRLNDKINEIIDVINKPVETTNEQPETCPKRDEAHRLLCSTCKKYCTITGEKITTLEKRF